MKLLDKVLTQCPSERAKTVAVLKTQVVTDRRFASVVVDDIARYYYHNPKDHWKDTDYPYTIPPWGMSFIEWDVPELVYKDEKWQAVERVQLGGLVFSLASRAEIMQHDAAMVRRTGASTGLVQHPGWNDSRIARGFVINAAYSSKGRTDILPVTILMLTDATGLPILQHLSAPGIEAPEMRELCHTILHMICLTFTFANCKNVKLVDKTSELEPKAKLKRRLKLPDVRRYTLDIGGGATKQASNHEPSGESGLKPLHLCRAHFATYTEAKPLFGKHVGKFWISQHVRGKRENGIVEKDYTVSPVPIS